MYENLYKKLKFDLKRYNNFCNFVHEILLVAVRIVFE